MTDRVDQVAVSPPRADVEKIVAALEQRDTVYEGAGYSGLVCPATVDVDADAVPRLVGEMNAIWEWNRVWHDLYSAHPSVRQLSDHGVPEKALRVQRRVLDREPEVARVDSVTLSPHQAVAEVQWKGGGEGFAAGVQDAYLDVIPCRQGQEPLGGVLAGSWASLYGTGRFVVTSTRGTWRRSEQFLMDALAPAGVDLTFIPRQVIARQIRVHDGHVQAQWHGTWRRVDYLSLDRLSEALPDALFRSVIECYERGTLHIEPPPSYLYSQKVGYALPWHPLYRDSFSDDVRSVLIPTVYLNDGPRSLALLQTVVEHPQQARLAELRSWDDLQTLPESLRRAIVVKCGSINGSLNHGGRGVWRLGSPATLAAVLRRIDRGEPWIAQPYVDRTWRVPLAMPPDGDPRTRPAHARFCLYVRRGPRLLGGLATFSTFWKSAGKSARTDDRGRMTGSAFVDLRSSTE
jgi:hypothetical protein